MPGGMKRSAALTTVPNIVVNFRGPEAVATGTFANKDVVVVPDRAAVSV